MKQVGVVFFCIVFLIMGYAFAQEESPLTDFGECVPLLHSIQAATADYIDLRPGCAAFNQCSEEVFMVPKCQLGITASLLQICDTEDTRCRNEALFAAHLVWIYSSSSLYSYNPSPNLNINLDEAFLKVVQNDNEGALQILTSPDLTDPHWFWNFHALYDLYSRGLVLEMLNRPEEAIDAYSNVVEHTYDYFPLSHFSRGLLYGSMGNEVEASFEAAWMTAFVQANAPELLPIFASLTAGYPVDESRLSTWMRYPVTIYIHSPGGHDYIDYTQEPPTPVQVAFYQDPDRMLVGGIRSLLSGSSDTPLTVLADVYPLEATENGYERFFDVLVGGDEGFSLLRMGDVFLGREYRYDCECSVLITFMLAPADLPDPRLLLGERTCEGGVISRLRAGMPVWEANYYSDPFYYSQSLGLALDYSDILDYPVHVVGEPVCVADQLWWQVVDAEGTTGWRSENDGNRYRINPADDQVQELFYCQDTLPTRLYVGGEASVAPGLGANRLRDSASLSGNEIVSIREGASVRVIGHPVCADGYAWWQVEYGAFTGWTAEGNSEQYWLIPVELDGR